MKVEDLQAAPMSIPLRAKASAKIATLPRVLYVVNLNPTDKFGSSEEQITILHRAFREEGGLFVPLFACPPEVGVTDSFGNRGVEAHCLNLREFRWGTLSALRSLIREQGIELVHWHFTEPIANPYLWALSALNPHVRHSFTDHISRPSEAYTPPGGWKRLVKRILLKRYAQTLCVSQFVKDCLAEQRAWSNVHVCSHFVNTDRFAPNPVVRAEMRRRFDVEDRFVVIVVAQMIEQKGIDVVLRALASLPEKAVLWLVGRGDQTAPLQDLARALGVAERVRFLGLQPHVEPFLQAANCFVLPSRWKEAAGLVLLEAQSAGLPVVASRIGGIPEYIAENRSGFLFSPENARELARHLGIFCDDTQLCRRMGQQARALAVERFSIASQLPTWLDYYRQYRDPTQLASAHHARERTLRRAG